MCLAVGHVFFFLAGWFDAFKFVFLRTWFYFFQDFLAMLGRCCLLSPAKRERIKTTFAPSRGQALWAKGLRSPAASSVGLNGRGRWVGMLHMRPIRGGGVVLCIE